MTITRWWISWRPSRACRLEAKHRIRTVLDEYANKHDISPKEVTKLIYGYVDDMLSDFFYDKEEELRDEISADIVREGQSP
ncbi:hypothetical protein BH10PSE6_BH10PSE6_06610 [soil metagenome]